MNTLSAIHAKWHILKETNKLDDEEAFIQLKSMLYKHYIKISYEAQDNKPTGRCILSTIKCRNTLYSNNIQLECNGIVLELYTWKVLCIPSTFAQYIIPRNIKISNKAYDMVEINDGTSINIYWYKDKWCISTAHGYDVSSIKWKNKTYSEILDDVLMNMDIKAGDFFNSLDKNSSYTFGFTHPDFHPIAARIADKLHYNMWFVCSSEINAPYTRNWSMSPYAAISCQKRIKYNGFKNMNNQLGNALDAFLDKLENVKMPSSTNNQLSNPLFGYVFIEKCPSNSNPRIYIRESSLLITIKRLVYDHHYNKQAAKYNVQRDQYVYTDAYLDDRKFTIFKCLFPQYNDKMDALHAITDKLSAVILNNEQLDTPIGTTAALIKEELSKKIQVVSSNKPNIHEYLINPMHIEHYLRLLNDTSL